jgi:osmotically-inducible protein OsmY
MARADEHIKKDVVDQLVWDGRVNAADVTVEVQGGAVTLNGTVPTYRSRAAAETAARDIAGVIEVVNDLSVRYPGGVTLPTDPEIEEMVRTRLSWSPDVDTSKVDVEIEEARVTLDGSVNAYWKRLLAEDLVSHVRGVVSIDNRLAVVPTEDVVDETIAEDVVGALERSALVDAEDVTVSVESGIVRLSGTVPSWPAREAAYAAALYTAGVVDVRDELAVAEPAEVSP